VLKGGGTIILAASASGKNAACVNNNIGGGTRQNRSHCYHSPAEVNNEGRGLLMTILTPNLVLFGLLCFFVVY
jgi:hypothetical protein